MSPSAGGSSESTRELIRLDADPLGYQPALDGMRAVAVGVVMLYHFTYDFTGGLIGVDVFFVLSGFLITSLLLDERVRTGSIDLRGFYHRRVLRLFPAMYALLAVVAVAAIFVNDQLPLIWIELIAAALYSYFLVPVFAGLATADSPRALFPLWSLSVEEWFYFIWPAVLIFGLVTRTRQRWVLVGAATTAAFWMAVRLLAGFLGVDWNAEEPFEDTGIGYWGQVVIRTSLLRFDMLIVGCLLAIYLRNRSLSPRTGPPRWLGPLAILGTGLLVAELLLGGRVELFDPWSSIGFNAALLGIVPMIAWIHLAPNSLAPRLLALPVMVWIGRRAYGIYLWHELVNVLTPVPGTRTGIAIRAVFLGFVTLGVAQLSWKFIESPFLRRKELRYGHRDDRRTGGPPGAGAGAGTG